MWSNRLIYRWYIYNIYDDTGYHISVIHSALEFGLIIKIIILYILDPLLFNVFKCKHKTTKIWLEKKCFYV